MAQFIVTVNHTPTGEDEEHRVSALDRVEAAFKVGLFIASQRDDLGYNELDAEHKIASIDCVHEERTREWDQA